MSSTRKNSALRLAFNPAASDLHALNTLIDNLKSARRKGLAIDEFLRSISPSQNVENRSTANDRNHLGQEIAKSTRDFDDGNLHTIDHVDFPACQAYDELVKAEFLGMSRQTFPEAANVWQRVTIRCLHSEISRSA